MAKHSVNVIVKARDEASRKFGVITASARVMGKALKGTASMIKTAFRASFQVIKRAAMGIAAAFAYATYAAMKQQDAEINLKGALMGLGIYTEKLMKDFKQFASAMQEATTYGDEYVLSLLKVAAAQTDSSEAAKQLVSDTLALLEIVPAGRMKPQAFMKMVLGFKQGGKELDTYLIALKGVTDETKRQEIYNKMLATAWGIWAEKINTAKSALIRMWNAVGDVAEEVGGPFLDNITESAKAVKKWAEDNQAQIGLWAEKTHSYITLIKDMFVDFVKFMKEDWRSGIQFVFDSFIRMMQATFESAVSLAIAGGKGIWKGVREGLLGGKEKELQKIILEAARKGGAYSINYETGKVTPLDVRTAEIIRGVKSKYEAEKVKSILGDTLKTVKNSWKEAFTNIVKDMPPELGKAFDEALKKHEERLKGIKKEPGKTPGKPGTEGRPQRQGLAETLARIKSLTPLRAGFGLTFAPGARINYEQETAKGVKELVKLGQNLIKEERNLYKLLMYGRPLLNTLRAIQGPTMENANFK